MPLHCLFQALHITINVPVEQSKKETEILGIALMRRSCHQKVVIRPIRQCLAELISKGLLIGAVRAHLVSFVDNDEVPLATEQALIGIFDARHPRY